MNLSLRLLAMLTGLWPILCVLASPMPAEDMPRRNPLVEIYTGMWCGGCPQAHVAAAKMKRDHPGFLAIAIHNKDRLATMWWEDYPNKVNGFPTMKLDRKRSVSYGDIEQAWLEASQEPSPAWLDVRVKWADEEKNTVIATSTLTFVQNWEQHPFRLAYALVEDAMSDPSWLQATRFTTPPDDDPLWEDFAGKTGWVSGVVYDDVSACYPSPKGIEGSVPDIIEAHEGLHHTTELQLSKAIVDYVASPIRGQNIIQDKSKLRVIAILVDCINNEVVTAATSTYIDQACPEEPSLILPTDIEASSPIAVSYYDMQGRQLEKPSGGITLKKEQFEDGRTRCVKIVR